jgi:ATP/maltotriose-dependent transcriptional regulator MalT
MSGRGTRTVAGIADTASVGELLRFLRRRARLTQRQLGLAVGYTEGHICRLEQNQRVPDVATLAARFVPALGLDAEPELADRLLELAAARHSTSGPEPGPEEQAIPPLPSQAVTRTRVLDALRTRLADERRVLVCGLAGVGKTSVAAVLAREAASTTPVCWITVTAGVTASADAVVRRLASFLHRRGHPEAGRLQRRRDNDAAVPLDEQLGLLAAALAREPVMVCLDNVHLLAADALAMAVLGHLTATTSTTLLLTAREDVPLVGMSTYRLAGLSGDEARALVAATHPLPPEMADRLIGRTAGSPMLLRLALGQLRDGAADAAFFVERLENEPQTTAYLLETTLGGLSTAAWGVLSLLAVFRAPVDLRDERLVELSQDLDGPYDLTGALDELQRRLLVDHSAAATLHPLVHDHVYTRMVSELPRRRRLHRVAALWSLQRDDILEASHHFAQAGEPDPAAALLTAHASGLIGRGQALAAADLTERLLQGDLVDAIRLDLLTVRGDLLANTVRMDDAEAAYRQAMAAATGARRAQVGARLAQILVDRGNAAAALRLCRDLAATDGTSDKLLLAQLAATTGLAHNRMSRYPEAIADAELALELTGAAGGAPTGSIPPEVNEIQARAYLTLGQATRIQQRSDLAVAHLQAAAEAAGRAARPALANQAGHALAAVYFEQGDMGTAAALFTQVLARCRELGDGYGAARVLLALTQVHLNEGDMDRALAACSDAATMRARFADRPGLANANCVRAEVLLACGRADEARDLIAAVVNTSGDCCGARERGYHLAVLGQAYLVTGDPAAAVAVLRTGVALPDTAGKVLRLLLVEYLALALLIAGDVAGAERLLDRPHAERALGADVPPGIRLDAYAVEVARALAHSDRGAAAEWVVAMARYAATTGRSRSRAVADRLRAAVAIATPADVPHLIWGR